jgi:hypothetical protein
LLALFVISGMNFVQKFLMSILTPLGLKIYKNLYFCMGESEKNMVPRRSAYPLIQGPEDFADNAS